MFVVVVVGLNNPATTNSGATATAVIAAAAIATPNLPAALVGRQDLCNDLLWV